jgi:hypothetical protein
MEFLKRHYEKMVLVVVLLGLAAAGVWMGMAIKDAQEKLQPPMPAPGRTAPPLPIDLSTDQVALAQITNTPQVVLSGDHNLFNPVTWKRKSSGELMKIVKIGPDALTITTITPLYTIIGYDHPSGNGAIYVMTVQQHCDLAHPNRKATEYAEVNEKMKSGLYIIRGIKGAPEDPTDLELEIPESDGNVWISKDKPYKRVDSYTVDMKYDPQSQTYLKRHVGDQINLDGEDYKIIEITDNTVRVESNRTKVTEVKWKP